MSVNCSFKLTLNDIIIMALASLTSHKAFTPNELKEWISAMKKNKTIKTSATEFSVVHSEITDNDELIHFYELYDRFNKVMDITINS